MSSPILTVRGATAFIGPDSAGKEVPATICLAP